MFLFFFIKTNRDICNWRMTNNKTFTSTFLTCPVQARSCGLICLLSMDYSNENRINACKNNISESCLCFPFFCYSNISKHEHLDRTILELSKKAVAWQIISKFIQHSYSSTAYHVCRVFFMTKITHIETVFFLLCTVFLKICQTSTPFVWL